MPQRRCADGISALRSTWLALHNVTLQIFYAIRCQCYRYIIISLRVNYRALHYATINTYVNIVIASNINTGFRRVALAVAPANMPSRQLQVYAASRVTLPWRIIAVHIMHAPRILQIAAYTLPFAAMSRRHLFAHYCCCRIRLHMLILLLLILPIINIILFITPHLLFSFILS